MGCFAIINKKNMAKNLTVFYNDCLNRSITYTGDDRDTQLTIHRASSLMPITMNRIKAKIVDNVRNTRHTDICSWRPVSERSRTIGQRWTQTWRRRFCSGTPYTDNTSRCRTRVRLVNVEISRRGVPFEIRPRRYSGTARRSARQCMRVNFQSSCNWRGFFSYSSRLWRYCSRTPRTRQCPSLWRSRSCPFA